MIETKIERYIKKRTQYENRLSLIKHILAAKEKYKIDYVVTCDDVIEIIFKAYIHCENVVEVANFINELGFKIKTDTWAKERKYIPKDITNILTDYLTIVDKELKEIVTLIMNDSISIKRINI